MGAGYMDYIMADRHVIPENHKTFYTEKVVYLPHNKKEISDRAYAREEVLIKSRPIDSIFGCGFSSKRREVFYGYWMKKPP
jgi:predicted O-linked N-acetylglucosamine transferase (SPINDLY family)